VDELQKGLDISVQGPVRERALARCAMQMAEWKIALPPVEPLVLDFGLGDFEHTGLIESRYAAVIREHDRRPAVAERVADLQRVVLVVERHDDQPHPEAGEVAGDRLEAVR
jgi:hypothetical protein